MMKFLTILYFTFYFSLTMVAQTGTCWKDALKSDLKNNSELSDAIKGDKDKKVVESYKKLYREGSNASEQLRKKPEALEWIAKKGDEVDTDQVDDLLNSLEGSTIDEVFEDPQGRLVTTTVNPNPDGLVRRVVIMQKIESGEVKTFTYDRAYNKAHLPGRPPISANGLTPDFKGMTNMLYPVVGDQKNIVRITLSSRRDGVDGDFARANAKAGFSGLKAPTGPDGTKYTWHHMDDFDPETGESTMQLVKTTDHQASTPHYGSAKQYEDYKGVTYN